MLSESLIEQDKLVLQFIDIIVNESLKEKFVYRSTKSVLVKMWFDEVQIKIKGIKMHYWMGKLFGAGKRWNLTPEIDTFMTLVGKITHETLKYLAREGDLEEHLMFLWYYDSKNN